MTLNSTDFPNSVTSAGLFLAGGAIGHCSEGKKKSSGNRITNFQLSVIYFFHKK